MTLTSLPSARSRAWLLIGLLMLASAGCTRRDWVGDLLVLTDVTGTWSGRAESAAARYSMRLSLRQDGAQVTGESSGAGQLNGTLQGSLKGEEFSFRITSPGFSSSLSAVLTVDGDETDGDLSGLMTGTVQVRCPCRVHLRRMGPAPTPSPQS